MLINCLQPKFLNQRVTAMKKHTAETMPHLFIRVLFHINLPQKRYHKTPH